MAINDTAINDSAIYCVEHDPPTHQRGSPRAYWRADASRARQQGRRRQDTVWLHDQFAEEQRADHYGEVHDLCSCTRSEADAEGESCYRFRQVITFYLLPWCLLLLHHR